MASSTTDNDIEKGYHFHSRKLGEGGYGLVRLATHLLTNQKVAIKIINKAKVGKDLFRIDTEINSLKMFKHRNIAKLLQVVENDHYIYLVMEYCPGGELFDRLIEKRFLSEKETQKIIRSLVEVLAYIHAKGVAHRDIKPENILLDEKDNIKLIDFGLAAHSQPNGSLDGLSTTCGSPAYVAPELLEGHRYSGPAADVWSTGVLMYTLLNGVLPFNDNNLSILYKKIKSGKFSMPLSMNKHVKNLLTRMLTTDPKQRITIDQILSHPWLNSICLNVSNSTYFTKLVAEEDDKLDDQILCKCAVLHECDMELLHGKVKNNYGYETATYWLVKNNPSKFKEFDYIATKSSINRRRSQSFSGFNSPGSKGLAVKRKEPVGRESIRQHVPSKIANTDVKTIIPMPNRRVFDDQSNRRPIRQNLFGYNEKGTTNKLNDTKAPISKPLPNLPVVRSRPPTFRPPIKEPIIPASIHAPKVDFKEPEAIVKIKSQESSSLSNTPTKKSLIKRILESATPRKAPRRFVMDNLEKNVTLTNYTDFEECKECIVRIMTAKKVNCTLKKCVLSSMNVVIVAFELELLVCNKTGCIGIYRKRIRGASWDYVKICEELSKVNKSVTDL